MNSIISVGKHNKTYDVNSHSHNMWEIVYCTSGSGKFVLNDKQMPYQKGEMVIIAPSVLHSNMSEEGFRNIYLTLNSPFLGDEDISKITDSSNKLLFSCMSQIYYFYNCQIYNKDAILAILGELIVNYIVAFSKSKVFSPVIEKLRNEIIKNFSNSSFSVQELFKSELGYNENYLKKLFKKELTLAPQQFLIDLRISYAKKLLSNRELNKMSVSDIAYDSGYDDPLYFSRVFKSFTGVSPINYKCD